MINKLLTLLVLLLMVGTITVSAQSCTPDAQYTAVGIYPDTLVGLPCAQTTVLYQTTITVITPTDSLYDLGPPLGTINATIDSIVVQDNTGDGIAVNGLPPGFAYVCNPPSCSWPGGSTGCILLIGTPGTGDAGTYNVVVEVDAYVNELVTFGNPPVNMDKVDQYSIVVSTTAPPVPVITSTDDSQGSPSCNGTGTVSGGVTYQWDNNAGGVTTPTAAGLCAGTYNVAAIDVNGCAGVGSATINYLPCTPTVAGFTSNSVGLDAVFTDASSDAVSWSWDFGDASTSTDQNPVHTYAADGTYNVCLITTNACSSDTTCTSVTVSAAGCPPCVAGFTSANSGLEVMFADASADVTGWLWDFADGNTSTSISPTHTYAAAGTYNVCLYTTNPCSVDTFCMDVTVTPTGIEQYPTESFNEVKTVPNPFSGTTSIIFDLGEPGAVNFVVIDRIGKVVHFESINGSIGANSIEFSAEGLAPGIYMYNLVSGVHSVTGKMSVAK
ncbi:MAG TPA: PKD domain-containing protein [Flavobacteriales bacterium]|nr:PKD domain-containing protein [Flavobacteriales bacterium]